MPPVLPALYWTVCSPVRGCVMISLQPKQLQETEDELSRIKTEKSTLWAELVSGRERISDLEEK